MKIIFCSNTSWYLWNYRYGLIQTLLASGNEIDILAPFDQTSEKFSRLGCNIYPISMNRKGVNVIQEIILVLRLYKVVKQVDPDVLVTFTVKPVIYIGLIARFLGIPVAATITGLGTAFIRKSWVTKVVKKMYKAGLASAHTVLFQNADDRDLFVKEGLARPKQAQQIPGSGIDLEKFSFLPKLDVGPEKLTIFLLAGRMLWDKGIREYIDAAKIVRDRYPNAVFQLLGEIGSDNVTAIPRAQILAWQDTGIISYLGVTSDIRPYIQEADCVVLPSYREGLSRTLLEAGAIGRPVLAARVTGCKEVVEDGRTGLLFHPRDSIDLAEKMSDFMVLPRVDRDRMGREARLKMEKEFDEKFVIQRYCKIISR